MIRRKFWTLAFVASLLAGGVLHAQTLPELARAKGAPIDKTLVREAPPVGLEELAAEATLVVEGTVTRTKSYLSSDQTAIYTDYRILPSKFHVGIDRRARPSLDPSMILTVYGGTITIEGVKVTLRDSALDPLPENSSLLLLLREGGAPGTFKLVGGEVSGAFLLKGGRPKTLMKQSPRAEEFNALTYDEMIGRVRKAAKAR